MKKHYIHIYIYIHLIIWHPRLFNILEVFIINHFDELHYGFLILVFL